MCFTKSARKLKANKLRTENKKFCQSPIFFRQSQNKFFPILAIFPPKVQIFALRVGKNFSELLKRSFDSPKSFKKSAKRIFAKVLTTFTKSNSNFCKKFEKFREEDKKICQSRKFFQPKSLKLCEKVDKFLPKV